MRSIMLPQLERCRIRTGPFKSDSTYGFNGVFKIIAPNGQTLTIIASDGEGWDHVSVSTPDRCPTWDEMCFVKDLFFNPDETVVQYHPKNTEYIKCHPYCLHMWRRQGREHELPPHEMIMYKPDEAPAAYELAEHLAKKRKTKRGKRGKNKI